MTVLVLPETGSQMAQLIDVKAWQLLGITAQEFRRAWYAGAYRGSTDPHVVALDTLMRTGRWVAPVR
jgi:hypothetical protein